jgi:hypothetical protein
MFKNYLKITFRSLWKNKVFVLINILGLGAAMACCIVAYLNYNFGASFDKDMQHLTDIYRVDSYRTFQDRNQLYGFSPIPLGKALESNVGEVDDVLRILPTGIDIKVEDEVFYESITYADPNFFSFFTFEMVSGDPDGLKDPRSILISDITSAKFFPDTPAVGQTITQLTANGPVDYEVAGVFKQKPLNSSFGGLRMISHIDNHLKSQEGLENDWTQWFTLFVRVTNKSSVPVIEERLTKDYTAIQNAARIDFQINSYALEPMIGMPQRAESGEVYGHWLWEAPPAAAINVPAVMALLILLIACFNFTNTSMAIAGKRIKEIGLRKVMGGVRKQLIIQFMLENLVLCLMALIAGLIMAAFLVPAYSAMWPFLDISLDFTGNYDFYLFLTIILLFTGFVAGSYPAFYVSKLEPAAILRRNLRFGGTNFMTHFLLGAQFTISLIAIIMGLIFYDNARYQEEMDYGFSATGTISLYFENPSQYQLFKNVVEQDQRILSYAGSEHHLDRSLRNDPIISGDKEYDVDIFHVGESFFETLNFKLIDGRKFRVNSETDMQESVIVTEEMVRVFGWDEPLGQKVIWMDTVSLYVVGVMKDVYTDGTWAPLSPMMLRYVPEDKYSFMTVQFKADDYIETNEFLKAEWKKLFPDKMYTGLPLDEELSNSAEVNNNVLTMFGFLGVIATFLSAMGLFSLVSLSILKRMKEIGVRKVLGASIPNIMNLINRNYMIILIIACLLAIGPSYFLADSLMDSIWTYHVTPGFMAFGLSIALIIVVALSTVGLKVFKAASANPTETMRME